MSVNKASNEQEQALVAALRRRDPDALSALFASYSDPLYRLAAGILRDDQSAEDVVQATFVALIQHVDRFDGRASLRTWLYRVAYNGCMQRLREPAPDADVDAWDEAEFMPPTLVDWRTLPEAVVTGAEARAEMARAIQALTPALRAVFTLRDIEGLSIREAAEALAISEAAVKVNLHRARLSLREQLTGYFEERAAQPGD
jgi:RNA polymerase sigma-70 factor (ECF subfamily)